MVNQEPGWDCLRIFCFFQIVIGLRGFSEIGGSVDRAPECIGSGPAIASTVQYTVH